MANLIARLTMIAQPAAEREVSAQGLRKNVSAKTASIDRIPIITNYKSLTYPIVIALVKAAWEAIKLIPAPWVTSAWLPLTLCLALGILIGVSNLATEKPPLFGWFLGLFLALLNSLVMFGAVMGIPH